MAQKKVKHTRKWLERAGQADSYLTVDIWPFEKHAYDTVPNRSIEMKLSDCSRSIFLSFSFYSEQERKRKLRKLDVIQAALDQVRNALEEEYVDPKNA